MAIAVVLPDRGGPSTRTACWGAARDETAVHRTYVQPAAGTGEVGSKSAQLRFRQTPVTSLEALHQVAPGAWRGREAEAAA